MNNSARLWDWGHTEEQVSDIGNDEDKDYGESMYFANIGSLTSNGEVGGIEFSKISDVGVEEMFMPYIGSFEIIGVVG